MKMPKEGFCCHGNFHIGLPVCPYCRLIVKDARIAELEAAAKIAVEKLRGSGGINPEAAAALNRLAALLPGRGE